MSQIDKTQGAVKASEIATETALPLLSTVEREDALTVLEQMKTTVLSSLRKSALLLTSSGPIGFSNGNLDSQGNNVVLRLMQNESIGAVNISIPPSVLDPMAPLADGEVMYLEITRQNASASLTISGAAGQRLVISPAASMPAMATPQSDTVNDSTLYIPIWSRHDIGGSPSLWTIPHGIYWPNNTSSVLGAVVTSTSMPVGSIMPYHLFGDATPIGTIRLDAVAPGWALCDGSLVTKGAFRNNTRDPDGSYNGGTNIALDRFTPDLNGAAATYNAATPTYFVGDRVLFTGLNFVCIQQHSSGSPQAPDITMSTAYWVREIDITQTNANSRFFRDGVDVPPDGIGGNFLKGASSSPFGVHAGGNTHTLTTPEMPAHNHLLLTQQNDAPPSFQGDLFFGLVACTWNGQFTAAYRNDGARSLGLPFVSPTGSSTAHNNQPRYFQVTYIIRVY